MNKRATTLVLQFLVVLLLAVVITFFSCKAYGSVFRLTSQAKESYTSLVNSINDLSLKGQENERKSEILLLDKETALVFFESQFGEVKVVSSGDIFFFDRPIQCQDDKNCLCLFREVQEESNYFKPQKIICYDLDYKIEMADCTPVGHEDVVTCSNGFFIGRKIKDFEGQQRVSMNLMKEKGKIVILK